MIRLILRFLVSTLILIIFTLISDSFTSGWIGGIVAWIIDDILLGGLNAR